LDKMRGPVPCNEEVKIRIPDGDNSWKLSLLFLFISGLPRSNSWQIIMIMTTTTTPAER
jgi:hypothetical protein